MMPLLRLLYLIDQPQLANKFILLYSEYVDFHPSANFFLDIGLSPTCRPFAWCVTDALPFLRFRSISFLSPTKRHRPTSSITIFVGPNCVVSSQCTLRSLLLSADVFSLKPYGSSSGLHQVVYERPQGESDSLKLCSFGTHAAHDPGETSGLCSF